MSNNTVTLYRGIRITTTVEDGARYAAIVRSDRITARTLRGLKHEIDTILSKPEKLTPDQFNNECRVIIEHELRQLDRRIATRREEYIDQLARLARKLDEELDLMRSNPERAPSTSILKTSLLDDVREAARDHHVLAQTRNMMRGSYNFAKDRVDWGDQE